jgi:glycerophosphoryl diester phosphodiesterase
MPRNIWLNVHIKADEQLGGKVAALIKRKGRIGQCILACEPADAEAARKVAPKIRICNMDRMSNSIEYAETTVRLGCEFIQLRTKDGLLPEALAILRDTGIVTNYYYANSPEKVENLFEMGVDFILTNDLETMLRAAEECGVEPLAPAY